MLFAAAGAAIQWFWAWRWDGVSFKSNPPAPLMDVPPSGCTVVACFHNEAPHVADFALGLKPALQTARAKGMSVEVVTVNHGSTDETGELLEKEAGQENHWQVVHASRTRAGKKEALALGVAAASANTVVVMDADCTPAHPDWLLHMTAEAGTRWDVQVGVSLPRPPTSRPSLLSLLQRIEAQRLAQRAVGAIETGAPYLGFGRNMAFTRDIWNRTQGMEGHEDLMSGDDDLWLQEAVRKGARVTACLPTEGQTTSQWPDTWKGWRRQKTRHFTASVAYPRSTLLRLGMPAMGWMLLAVGVVHNPSGTSMALATSAVLIRTLTFGLFLHRMDPPFWQAWTLLLEPAVSLFRGWAWWKGQTSDLTPWK